jgi:hypothetical protein
MCLDLIELSLHSENVEYTRLDGTFLRPPRSRAPPTDGNILVVAVVAVVVVVRDAGSMTKAHRVSEIARFKADPSVAVFLISLKTGNCGLNLIHVRLARPSFLHIHTARSQRSTTLSKDDTDISFSRCVALRCFRPRTSS